jgi:hypothetical protein
MTEPTYMTSGNPDRDLILQSRAAGIELESYDPGQLIADVQELLRSKGLHPDVADRLAAASANASWLLRAFGILPAGDHTITERGAYSRELNE